GIEPLVLAGLPGLLVVQLDAGRFRVPTVDDGRDAARAAQAAARTLPCVLAAECRDLVFVCHGASLSLCLRCAASRRLVMLTRDQVSQETGSVDVERTDRLAERDPSDRLGEQLDRKSVV